jgi:type 1 glutamine amidotransferase
VLVLILVLAAPVSAQDELRIHIISGSAEYESEPSLRGLQRVLEHEYEQVTVTASWGRDAGDHLDGIAALAEADLLIVFTRRMVLPEDQLRYIREYFVAEKPALGIRTASHAFQGYLQMDAEVFGGDYSGHGDDEPVAVSISGSGAQHPILAGVESWSRPDKLYRNPGLGPNTEILLYGTGQLSGLHEPLAWTNQYGTGGRAFYTSMGYPGDFENQNFQTLIFNAIEWLVGRDLTRRAGP